ncbi:MAG: NAD(P)-binding protein [Cytophagia bacterium]|nr:NAD(P)-binding protein [Cytophagia bacterium]
MNAAHKMRDGLYNTPNLATRKLDQVYDTIIIGGGMSGLGAAYYFKQNASADQKCLLLDNHPIFGGEAKRNEFMVDGVRLMGPQGSNDFGVPRKGSGSMTDKLLKSFKYLENSGIRSGTRALNP